jgi:hypothetical protein
MPALLPLVVPPHFLVSVQALSLVAPPLLLGFFTPEGTSFGTWQNGILDLLETKLPPYPSADGHHAKAGAPAEVDTWHEQSRTAVRCTADVTLQVRDPPYAPPLLVLIAHTPPPSVHIAPCTSTDCETQTCPYGFKELGTTAGNQSWYL